MSKNYLQINSSLAGAESLSSGLAARTVERLAAVDRAAGRAVTTTVRDLARDPLPHLTAERFGALGTSADRRTPAQERIVAESDALVAELQAADVLVIGLPMYNLGVPSSLKSWFDHIARAGVTFRYTPQGPQGLLTGKRAYVVATRGGKYAGTPQDLQSAYVRQFLAFLGIVDVEFIYAEGVALGAESREVAIAEASRRLEELAAA